MRVLVQEVLSASVKIEGKEVGSIARGFLLFVGFTSGDDEDIIKRMVDKVLKLRVFPDENGKTNLSLGDVGGEVLSVSQFTLYASAKEGNRPSFINAMRPEEAKPLFAYWNNILRERIPNLQTGVFGADMKVSLINDGPFTLWLDSKELFNK
ncbi:MAG: D-aminoacyl-tRNA deacylase [Bacilli bacterium]|jgi:D-tyrosyl-tRNA(Tyr) deacylase|nr:D-aminoacyl-tRNA deacylase [Bacilli bacterium]